MARGRPSRDSIYRALDDAVELLNTGLGGLPRRAEAESIWTDIWHEEAHHSTAIEGNTLILNQVRKLLDEGRAVGDKTLKEYMEVQGYADAARWVYGQAIDPGDWTSNQLISLQEVRNVHYEVMTPVWDVAPHPHAYNSESPGNWRQHEIEAFPQGMQPPPFSGLDHLVHDWVTLADGLRAPNVPFPEALAQVHNRFERIHPFLDGNGRTGRLILNLMLVRLGYPPAIIYKRDRDRYLDAMRKADADDSGPLGELLARAVTDNLLRFVVPAVAGPARLVPLASLQRGDLSASALRKAAERGKLKAQKQANGQWMSSRSWVDEYLASRHQRNR